MANLKPLLRAARAARVIRGHLDGGSVVTKNLIQLFEDTAVELANRNAMDCTMDLVRNINNLGDQVTIHNALEGDDWSEDGLKLIKVVKDALTRLGTATNRTTELLQKANDAMKQDITDIRITKMQRKEEAERPTLLYNMHCPEQDPITIYIDRPTSSYVEYYLLAKKGINADIWITRYKCQTRTLKQRSWEPVKSDTDVKGGLIYYVDTTRQPYPYVVVLRSFPLQPGVPTECLHECRPRAVSGLRHGEKCPHCACTIDSPELIPHPVKKTLSRNKLKDHLSSHLERDLVLDIFSVCGARLTEDTFDGARRYWKRNTLVVSVQKDAKDEKESRKGNDKAIGSARRLLGLHDSRRSSEQRRKDEQTNSMVSPSTSAAPAMAAPSIVLAEERICGDQDSRDARERESISNAEILDA